MHGNSIKQFKINIICIGAKGILTKYMYFFNNIKQYGKLFGKHITMELQNKKVILPDICHPMTILQMFVAKLNLKFQTQRTILV